jgi:hypothetical protein
MVEQVTILCYIVTMKCLIEELIKIQAKFMNGVNEFISIAQFIWCLHC